ncbi:MAG: hypothetical protein EAS51_04220 [Microbacteriaceae bacterium]|nr:MAG: hypothetical protein EAS51_04220 [Microbacteriaceae bacterium]
MNQDPRKRPNGTYKPKDERPPRHVNCRSSLEPVAEELLARAIAAGLPVLAFAIFGDAFVRERVRDMERAAGILEGPPNAPASWEGLEAVLGKDQVDRLRALR